MTEASVSLTLPTKIEERTMGIQKDGIGIYIGILGYYSIPIVLSSNLVGSVKLTEASVKSDTFYQVS